MSRSTTTSRAAFTGAWVAGAQIVMNTKTALELGRPIRGNLAFTSTSSLAVPSPHPNPVLSLLPAPSQLRARLDLMYCSAQGGYGVLQEPGRRPGEEYFASRVADMELEAGQQEKDALATYGMLEGIGQTRVVLGRFCTLQ
ncbi:unnamed protein product [Peniophora sp. CBMAI 1063]|nr:unnamed protein product [Peniophora sp. CBMAI 1063]